MAWSTRYARRRPFFFRSSDFVTARLGSSRRDSPHSPIAGRACACRVRRDGAGAEARFAGVTSATLAIEQLERALEDYDGTVLLVTHDRRFLERFEPTRTVTLS